MTDQEYKECENRVKQYSMYNSLLEKLKEEQTEISLGIMRIQTRRGWKIDFPDGEEFSTGLKETVINFYKSEIKRLRELIQSI